MASPVRRRLRRLGFHLLEAMAWCTRPFGLKGLHAMGRLVGDLRYYLGIGERRSLQRQLQHVLAGRQPPERIPSLLRDAYRECDRGVLEIVAMRRRTFSPAEIAELVEIDRTDRLQGALDQGNGVILLGMHMANGILMAARLAADGLPITVVYRESRKMPPGFFDTLLTRHGMEGISANQRSTAYRQMLRALRRGRVLYILMDQATKHGGIPVEFLGKQMDMPPGPAELARRSSAPVLPALPHAARPRWRFSIGEALDMDVSGTETSARRLAECMESHILAYPELWTWHHRRWRRHPFLTKDTSH